MGLGTSGALDDQAMSLPAENSSSEGSAVFTAHCEAWHSTGPLRAAEGRPHVGPGD